jgi:hypothetical protein
MLIGLCGAAGSGKDTVASILRETAQFYRVAFADPLYEMVAIVTGLMPEDLQDRELKEAEIDWIGRSPRQLLQTLGTEWGRNTVSESLWIDIGMRRIGRLLADGRSVAVTDVRFDNEAAAIKAAGGEVWRIIRGEGCVRGVSMRHASEAGISELLIDRTIGNWGSLASLRETVDAAVQAGKKATIQH